MIDFAAVRRELHKASIEINSPYTDGFTAFEYKKSLWRIKFLLDDLIDRSGTFAGEEDWIEEERALQAQQKIGGF